MRANTQIDSIDDYFNRHPSMDATAAYSTPQRPSAFRIPTQTSGFVERRDDASISDIESTGQYEPWSPPPWRPPESSSNWYRDSSHSHSLRDSPMRASIPLHSPAMMPSARRATSPPLEDFDAANIAIPPGSPGSISPCKELSPDAEGCSRAGTRQHSPVKTRENGMVDAATEPPEEGDTTNEGRLSNYIRFSTRIDVQQRTEPIERAIEWLRNSYRSLVTSPSRSIACFALVLMLAAVWHKAANPVALPRPDFVGVAQFTKTFEPMIQFSEYGTRSIAPLSESKNAVWDLAETIKLQNLTSGPIIIEELTNLEHSLSDLGDQLSRFFADVNGDFSAIVQVIDWARRELSALDGQPAGTISGAFGGFHSLLAATGLVSAENLDDPRNRVFNSIFGMTETERTHRNLERIFIQILSQLEETIDSELSKATAIFQLYQNIDKQFANLKRATAREQDTQENQEAENLASLWHRALGTRSKQIAKYAKNKRLLGELHGVTRINQNLLAKHETRLRVLKLDLDVLRQALMSPLLKVGQTGYGLEPQVKELEETAAYMRRVRDDSKAKVMASLHAAISGDAAAYKVEELDGPK